jgi:hypothetical protein
MWFTFLLVKIGYHTVLYSTYSILFNEKMLRFKVQSRTRNELRYCMQYLQYSYALFQYSSTSRARLVKGFMLHTVRVYDIIVVEL